MDVLAADQVVFLAGAVAYQFFFAIIPLLALAIGVLGFIYGSERAVDAVSSALRQIYPASGNEELAIVRQLSEGRALALGLGLLGTIVTVTAIHGALDAALAAVLGRAQSLQLPQRRGAGTRSASPDARSSGWARLWLVALAVVFVSVVSALRSRRLMEIGRQLHRSMRR